MPLAPIADALGIMSRNNRTNRSTRRTVPPSYARSLAIDEMPEGGVRSVPQLQAWQLPVPKVWRHVVVGGGLKPRLTTLVR